MQNAWEWAQQVKALPEGGARQEGAAVEGGVWGGQTKRKHLDKVSESGSRTQLAVTHQISHK